MGKRFFYCAVLVALSGVVGGSLVKADPVGHWTFDEGAGITVIEVLGSGSDGELNGTPEWAVGRIGGALELGGDQDYVVIPNSEGLKLRGGDGFTVAVWIKVQDPSAGVIVYHGLGCSTWASWFLGVGGPEPDAPRQPDNLVFGVRSGNGSAYTSVAAPVEADVWVHVAATYDGATLTLYIDGSEAGSVDAPTPWDSGENLFIGGDPGCGGRNWYTGAVDDLWIFDHVLSEGEVMGLMSAEPLTSAFGPSPKDGAMAGETTVQLAWRPGDFASSHEVYFGESFEDVNESRVEPVAVADASLTVGAAPPFAAGLTPGQTYYWRVDEVNDLHPDSPWRGDVWSFWVQPVIAWDPSPADGVRYVLLDPELTWENGMNALFHTVYFGESLEEVRDAAAGGFMTASASHAPGPLQAETTYYWRVDEFAATGITSKGDVWSFTTLPEIAVTDPDLMGWWRLLEGAGATAVDWSGHGNHGTIRGDAQWIDGALTFDGRNDYVSVVLDVSETEYAAAFWFKTTNANCGLMAVVQNDLGGGGHDRHVYLTGGNIKIRLWDTEEIESAGSNLANGQWHHVVYTYGAAVGGQKLYIDGVEQASGTKDASDFDWQERINIGFSNDATRDYFEGVLEDVRVYGRTLSAEEVQQVMRGDPLLAWNPQPLRDATVDIRDATALRWNAGDTAVSHDVYLGTDRDAVAAAGKDAAEYRGGQPSTSLSLSGLVEFGGGAYYWRIDEVEADGTVHAGNIWKFTIPAYLIVDDFESYTNEVGSRAFEVWVDGVGFTLPEPGNPGNGTGAVVGHDIWSPPSPYFEGTIMETSNVYAGGQAMPIYYDNTSAPGISEADRTFTPGRNWTAEGVTTLVVHFRGEADNTGALYVEINGVKVPYDGDPADIAGREWIAWEIDLASVGVSLTNITTLTIGIEGGQTGVLYVDDVILTR